VAGALALVGLILLWLIFGRGPRRARGYRRAQRLIRQGHWQAALDIVTSLQRSRLNAFWQGRLRNAEGECQRTAGVQAVQAKDFEKGLEHHLQAAELLHINPAEVRASVIEKMLAEVRALFASTSGADTLAVHEMADRVLILQAPSPCAEASFWKGLCHIREGSWDQAQQELEIARSAPASEPGKGAAAGYVDPPVYLGGVLLRLGQPKEALRYVTEANRLDSNCPLVALHLGMAMVAAGTDGNLATRALNRALGSRGLPAWIQEPDKAWVDGMPDGRSFIRKLAAKHNYVCPLWGSDLRKMVREGQLALGQAFFRLGQFQDAADTFQKLLDESAPTHDVLRWLGLALARLDRHQDAFKHLKTALDLEEPKDRLTAGYLAMCAACAKPDHPEDKGPNVAWAVRTVRQYSGFGDQEWVGILKQVFGEALQLNMALAGEDQVFYCDHLLSVQAADREAAEAYHHLTVDHPDLVKPPYAWLYCRAAMQHNLDHSRGLDLFARTFQTAADARSYFAGHKWDFEELEYAFLKQAAIKAPGAFPAALGDDYPPRGEAMLLERSERLEKENKHDAALASADVLLRLAPRSSRAHDRLAMLWHRRGKLDRAAEFLRNWCAVEPENPLPWTRLAVVQHNQGNREQCRHSMQAAIERANGKTRADLACLAGRLLLTHALTTDEAGDLPAQLEQAQQRFQRSLADDPHQTESLWLSAAVRAVLGDRAGLAAQASSLDGKDCPDARFQYFAAVSHLAANKPTEALAAADKAAENPALKVEAAYLAGWANIHRQDPAAAVTTMNQVAQVQESPSCNHARAILGGIRFHQGATDDAIQWWQGLDPQRRTAWQLAEPLQKSLYLAGLQALQNGQFEQAAEKLREAGKAGLRERALGSLIQYALLKAGQRLLYQEVHG
ncbi:MAG TPA: tetratricopeptide repeat protein, partial [Gemmataceae bacterium]|nr:tetratricopeptide repeat protein [Gemmataceae bacterium]